MSVVRLRTPASPDTATAPLVVESLHTLRVAITVFDNDERLIFANDHFGYMFHALPPTDELIGRRCDEILRLEFESGEIALSRAAFSSEEIIDETREQIFSGDIRPRDIALDDGRIIEIKTRRVPGKGWIALWTDVTRARQTFEQLRATIALSADAFAFYDRGDRLTLCNDEYAAINGAASPDDLVGLLFSDVLGRIAEHAIAEADVPDWLTRRLAAHHVPAGALTSVLRNGTAYLVRDRAASDGGRIVVLTDVTEHHRVEKALDEQTRALNDTRQALAVTKAQSVAQANYLADLATKLDQTTASADSTKKTLLRTMSHELKTPLNAIIGFSDLLSTLADQATPEQVREYSGLIHTGGNNLLKLINQILDLTKISAGRYELNHPNLDAGLSLWNPKDAFDGRAADKDIAILIEDGPAGAIVRVDEGAYTAMLHHLTENAVNFTQRGGEVRLKAVRQDGRVRITVADNGPGVPTKDLSRILEPFEQVGTSTTDHTAGAGLGLTLVKAFCEMHNGALTLESAPGAGFTAIIDLPAAE